MTDDIEGTGKHEISFFLREISLEIRDLLDSNKELRHKIECIEQEIGQKNIRIAHLGFIKKILEKEKKSLI